MYGTLGDRTNAEHIFFTYFLCDFSPLIGTDIYCRYKVTAANLIKLQTLHCIKLKIIL
jgi:hypothetical protein